MININNIDTLHKYVTSLYPSPTVDIIQLTQIQYDKIYSAVMPVCATAEISAYTTFYTYQANTVNSVDSK